MSFTEKNRKFLKKLQNLPEHQKKIILWAIVVILAVIMGYFWVNSAIKGFSKLAESTKSISLPSINIPSMPSLNVASENGNSGAETATDKTEVPPESWKTYTNSDYGFVIEYPSDWALRDYKTGVALSPEIESTGNGAINMGFYKRGAIYCDIPFADYVKIAGPSEIQNYKSLNTINGSANNNEVQMYKTTWNYDDLQGNGEISLPITYFETKPELCGDIEAFLNDNNYSDVYNTIISNFQFTK